MLGLCQLCEGIYVGYRFYETRWIDNETGECDEAAYRAAVQYPFGYGLSYTSFSQTMGDLSVKDGTISVDVTVTNTSDTAGKDVIQLYYTAPYTVGGIEKSHVVLCAFDKTSLLEPGASETLTLSFAIDDMASYDYINSRCYVLDQGDYEIKLMKNAHEVIDSRTYTVDHTVTYDEGNPRSSDLIAAVNQLDEVSFGSYGEGTSYVSRADWEETLPTIRTRDHEASAELLDQLNNPHIADDSNDIDITFGNHGLKLVDMKGLAYDDPQWDLLLEQMSVAEMAYLVGVGGYITAKVKSIDKPKTNESEGPSGMNSIMNGISGVQYASPVVLASTWNIKLAEKMGQGIGDECTANGYDGIMAPGMNTHGGISVGEDGASHQCCEDFALMRSIPGMVVMSPADDVEAKAMVKAAYEYEGPVYMRFSRYGAPVIHNVDCFTFEIGKGEVLRDGSDVALIANGLLVAKALEAANILAQQGISVRVIDMATINPLDEELVLKAACECGRIVTCEEHSIIGGLGEAVCAAIAKHGLPCPVERIGVNDEFGHSGPAGELLKQFGLYVNHIAESALKLNPPLAT